MHKLKTISTDGVTAQVFIDGCGCWKEVECRLDDRVAGMRPALDGDKNRISQ